MNYPAKLANANQRRAGWAAALETDRVQAALHQIGPNTPPHLAVAAQLRLDNPTASYTELATIAGLTKDQVRSRIRQLLHLADQHRRKDAA